MTISRGITHSVRLWMLVVLAAIAIPLLAAWILDLWTADLGTSLIATFVGVLGGASVALALAVLQRDQERADRQLRRGIVLGLVQQELQWNDKQIRGNERGDPTAVFLRHDTWRAMSDGGDLTLIENPALLGQLADAYFHVDTVRFLQERRWIENSDRTRAALQNRQQEAAKAIKEALAQLNGTQSQRHTAADRSR